MISLDRPGLLAQIGALFAKQNINIKTARIATLGERAEDVFFVTDTNGNPLDNDAAGELGLLLMQELDAQNPS